MTKRLNKLVREVRSCLWPCGMILATALASILYHLFLTS